MVENQSGTFILEADKNLPQRGWLSLRLSEGESLRIGNPIEGQYLRLQKYTKSIDKTVLKVFEKLAEDMNEVEIGNYILNLNSPYRLKGTSLRLSAHQGGFIRVNAPKNVDIMRDELFRKGN